MAISVSMSGEAADKKEQESAKLAEFLKSPFLE